MGIENAWQMYSNVLDRRRQKKQDAFAREKWEADQAYRKQLQANDDRDNDYRQQIRQDDLDKKQRDNNIAAMDSIMSDYTAVGKNGDAYLNNRANLDSINQVVRSSQSLHNLVTMDGDRPNYKVAGIQKIDTQQNEDGSPSYRYALMIDTGETDAEGNPALKPLSATRGQGDSVPIFTASGTMEYIEKIIQKDRGFTNSQVQTASRQLGDENITDAQILGEQETTEAAPAPASLGSNLMQQPQPQEVADPDHVTVTPLPSQDVQQAPVQTQTQPVEGEELPIEDIVADLVDEVTDQYSQNIQSLAGHSSNEVAIENKLVKDVMDATGVSVTEAKRRISEYRTQSSLPMESEESTSYRVGKAAVDAAKSINASVVEPIVDGYSAVSSYVEEAASDFVDGASDAIADKPNTTGGAPTVTTNTGQETSVQGTSTEVNDKLTKAAATVAQNATPQLVEASNALIINASKKQSKPADRATQDKRAQAIITLVKAGVITTPPADKLERFVRTGTLGESKLKSFTHGDWDYVTEVNSMGMVIASQRQLSSGYKSRIATLLKTKGADAAAEEKARVKRVGDNWEQAAQVGMGNAGGADLVDNKFGKMIGSVPQADFQNYFMGVMRSNSAVLQSVLPAGMSADINKMSGSDAELGVLSALASATAGALKDGTFTKDGVTEFSAGDFMAILKRYPPAQTAGVYVYGNQIHSVELHVKGYAQAQGIKESEARAKLHAHHQQQLNKENAALAQ